MKINIYDRKKVVKTYETDAVELEMGVMEDILGAIDLNKLQSLDDSTVFEAVRDMMTNGKNAAYELLHLIFDDITDEEIRHTHVSEITAVLVEALGYGLSSMMKGVNSAKNRGGVTRR